MVVPGCSGFYRKMHYLSAFLIHILLMNNGNCNLEYNALEVHKLLNILRNDKDLRSFNFYPVKIYLKADKHKGHLNPNVNFDKNFNFALRTAGAMDFAKDKVATSKTGKLLRYQHRKKMEELIEFLRERYSSTNYFYSEMQRIKQQYTIKDKMREMIDYCEHPQNYKVKNKILKLFDKLKKKNEVEQNLWSEATNDLVINVLQDPYNNGVVK